ncbi:MAG TPA: glycosyltransferase [Thermoanaerobaculia bacterium]|nr:glycosyltransferase [Thermoanaerobaculia bacterium]
MRLAWFSPLPPQRSGIADYSAELLPHLAEHLDLELFVDEGVRVDPEIRARFPVHGDRAFPEMRGRFDAVLYHLGNNVDYHARAWRMAVRFPGVVVLHEAMLHHLVRGMTLSRGDLDGYVEEMRYAYGRTGHALARRSVDTGIPLDVWSYPLFERIVDSSLALIVHNDFTRQRVLASRPLARVSLVPHHLSLGDQTPTDRAALGIPQDAFVLASYGFITPAKRLEVSLRAFSRLRAERPDALYLLVGEVSPHYEMPRLPDGVVHVGHTELDEFLRYMVAADVAVNLRYPTSGETSGTLIRLLGLGKPVIVSNLGAFAEIPDGACAKVDLDETEEDLLLEYLRRLAADEGLRRQMGENARRFVVSHTLEASSRGYAEVVRTVAEEWPVPFRAVPPLAPYPPGDVLSDLAAELSAGAVDLGVGETDDDLLRELAATLVDLGLDGLDGRAA